MAVHKIPIIDSSDTTASASDILQGKTAISQRKSITGTIPILESVTYIPGTSDITIPGGQYLDGEQVIKGDSNLTAENIISGKSIFGVNGNAKGDTSTCRIAKSTSSISVESNQSNTYTLPYDISDFNVKRSYMSIIGCLDKSVDFFSAKPATGSMVTMTGTLYSVHDYYNPYFQNQLSEHACFNDLVGKEIGLETIIYNYGTSATAQNLKLCLIASTSNGTQISITNLYDNKVSIYLVSVIEFPFIIS